MEQVTDLSRIPYSDQGWTILSMRVHVWLQTDHVSFVEDIYSLVSVGAFFVQSMSVIANEKMLGRLLAIMIVLSGKIRKNLGGSAQNFTQSRTSRILHLSENTSMYKFLPSSARRYA